MFSSLVPHLPAIKAELGLTNAAYGLAIAAVPTGAILAGPAAGWCVRRFGSAATAFWFTVLAALVLVTVPFAPSQIVLMVSFFCLGAADSITDVGQNAHGLRVQRVYGRSIINSLHAIWSVGAVTGGALAALAIWAGMARPVHLVITAVAVTAGSFFAYTRRLPGPDSIGDESAGSTQPVASAAGPVSEEVTPVSAAQAPISMRAHVPPPSRGRTVFLLTALSLIAIAGALVEDAGSTWAAVYLGENLGAAASIASLGFIFLVGSQFVGRLLGDGLVDRFGQRTVVRAGGVLIFMGMGLALLFPSIPLTILGFALAGFGSATLVPAAYQVADELPGLSPGTGLTIVSWMLRVGFLVSPPLVGVVADASSLRVGLLVLPIAGVLTLLCSRVLTHSRSS